MFGRIQQLAFTLTISVLGACASGPPVADVDYDPAYQFTDVKKIAFYAKSGKTSGTNPTRMTDFQKERVDSGLRRALESRGFEVVDQSAEADLLISWHLNTVEKQDIRTTSSPNYGMSMGYSRYNRYAMYSCYDCFGTTDTRVTEYTQGTFIVDMIDPQKRESVWRSVTQSKLKGEALKDQAKIDQGAMIVLKGFPPGSIPNASN